MTLRMEYLRPTGTDVLRALYHSASRIDAVELNAQLVDLVRRDFGEFAGHIYERPEVALYVAEARSFRLQIAIYVTAPILPDKVVDIVLLFETSAGQVQGDVNV